MRFKSRCLRSVGCCVLVWGVLAASQSAVSNADDKYLPSLLEDVAGARGVRFDAKDSLGQPLHCPRVLALREGPAKYAAVYHVPKKVRAGVRFSVHLATSDDLTTWTHVRQLIDNADMPCIVRTHRPGADEASDRWILLCHEQWMGAGVTSNAPSQLGFKFFYNDADLLAGNIRHSWIAPINAGLAPSGLMGTPDVYRATMRLRGDRWGLDARVGFHFNNRAGRDEVGEGLLVGFGTSDFDSPPWNWLTGSAAAYNHNLTETMRRVTGRNSVGNIGQRVSFQFGDQRYSIQEGNIQQPPVSPTRFEDWRLWLYHWTVSPKDSRSDWPSGHGSFKLLSPKTPGESLSFGNPGIVRVPAPDGQGDCLFISYFVFSEGATSGEAGSLIFHQPLPEGL